MRQFIVLAALAIGACGQAAERPPSAPEMASACAAHAASTWSAGAGRVFAIEANSSGDDCATAAVTLTIRDDAGTTVFTESHQSDQVMTLAGAESVDDLRRRLGEWITPPGVQMDSTGDLPEWVQGAEHPVNEEFPFYPEEDVTRDYYEALRAQDRAMFCYVQGMESMACLAMRDGALAKIGVQSFPG